VLAFDDCPPDRKSYTIVRIAVSAKERFDHHAVRTGQNGFGVSRVGGDSAELFWN